MGSLSRAWHMYECDRAHLHMEMVQSDLSWCESVQWLQRYGFRDIRMDGRTDGRTHGRTDGQTDARMDTGYFIVPLQGFFEPAGDKKKTCSDPKITQAWNFITEAATPCKTIWSSLLTTLASPGTTIMINYSRNSLVKWRPPAFLTSEWAFHNSQTSRWCTFPN